MNEVADAHIEQIDRDEIIARWAEGMSIGQIAQATGQPVPIVRRELKEMQKDLVEQNGGGHG